jgi:ubiquinone/menaquinone biosynthesis C-methylase UbiE
MGINTLGWNRTRYRAYAPVYDMIAAPLQAGRRQALTALDLRPGERALILGCGTGLDLPLLPAGVDVTAIDLTPTMLRYALARAASSGRPLRAAVMNGQQLALPDATFDVVLLHLVLAVVPDPVACAREAARVLRPGGRVSIFDKWLPEGATPSPARRALNAITATAFSDINRQLNPILAAAELELISRAPAGLGGIYQVALARKPAG